MCPVEEIWYDDEAGPIVRLYMRVGGRTSGPRDGFDLSAIVHRVPGVPEPDDLSPDQQATLRLLRRPIALSEVAARLGLPLGPARLLLADMRDAGLVDVRRRDAPPDVLERLLSGLNSL
ncbi:DUF742 domain-containing protein [Actinoplanes sp. HUAS TT8]|uniref:DUF742 domain-containing protein n=1 Tax=Actinoplanes sp. HUAS TT8 TaxID=3447453 RepID=UPI003F51BA33